MEEVARYECVYNRGRKDFKDKNKRPTVGTKSGRSFIYRPGKRRPNFATSELRTVVIESKTDVFDGFRADDDSLHDKKKK